MSAAARDASAPSGASFRRSLTMLSGERAAALDEGGQRRAAGLIDAESAELQGCQREAVIDAIGQSFEEQRRALVAQLSRTVSSKIIRQIDSQTAQPGKGDQRAHLFGIHHLRGAQSPGDTDVSMAQQRGLQTATQLQRPVALQSDGRRPPGEEMRGGGQCESTAARESKQRRRIAAVHHQLQLDSGQPVQGADCHSSGGGSSADAAGLCWSSRCTSGVYLFLFVVCCSHELQSFVRLAVGGQVEGGGRALAHSGAVEVRASSTMMEESGGADLTGCDARKERHEQMNGARMSTSAGGEWQTASFRSPAVPR